MTITTNMTLPVPTPVPGDELYQFALFAGSRHAKFSTEAFRTVGSSHTQFAGAATPSNTDNDDDIHVRILNCMGKMYNEISVYQRVHWYERPEMVLSVPYHFITDQPIVLLKEVSYLFVSSFATYQWLQEFPYFLKKGYSQNDIKILPMMMAALDNEIGVGEPVGMVYEN